MHYHNQHGQGPKWLKKSLQYESSLIVGRIIIQLHLKIQLDELIIDIFVERSIVNREQRNSSLQLRKKMISVGPFRVSLCQSLNIVL
jgi:hypothetical protein